MINIENTKVYNVVGAVYSARNAMNSWNLSDSNIEKEVLGEKDLKLAKKLAKAGTDHRKFMRMITVYVDITAPLYWFKQADQYKIGVTTNSTSTMHKISDKEFELTDFSHEHLTNEALPECWNKNAKDVLVMIIGLLNANRLKFIETKDKKYWWQMIQLLPSSYNQKRTVMLNYEVLMNIYNARKSHKLDEWREFCKWIETLPYSELITG